MFQIISNKLQMVMHHRNKYFLGKIKLHYLICHHSDAIQIQNDSRILFL